MSTVAQTKPKKKTAAANKPLSHPTFAEMITEAIANLKERTGSSQYAVTKFIEEKHEDSPPTFRKLVKFTYHRVTEEKSRIYLTTVVVASQINIYPHHRNSHSAHIVHQMAKDMGLTCQRRRLWSE
ncbi:histone H1 [Lathyrus oleraceus]|uniref:histone H1 n=1 Tax=Pisum sativum TaxID=3888 RepID=UPI0021D1C450|nr:histone H1-like [Pisum sativum]